jgi:hypothetical protein
MGEARGVRRRAPLFGDPPGAEAVAHGETSDPEAIDGKLSFRRAMRTPAGLQAGFSAKKLVLPAGDTR